MSANGSFDFSNASSTINGMFSLTSITFTVSTTSNGTGSASRATGTLDAAFPAAESASGQYASGIFVGYSWTATQLLPPLSSTPPPPPPQP